MFPLGFERGRPANRDIRVGILMHEPVRSHPMAIEEVIDATYGPYSVEIAAAKVGEYVGATGDAPERWDRYAPPGYASALLFAAAPRFLDDPRVKPFTGVLVHVDQTFTWHRPFAIGAGLVVSGRVDRVRERQGSFFVTFVTEVDNSDGDRVLDAVATFLMGEGSLEASEGRREPEVWVRGHSEHPTVAPVPRPAGASLAPLTKSASRIDLVKYAGATGDFNPIHFDHQAALSAGLQGIVVHGLLTAAWVMQVAASVSERPDPIAHLKFRFRNPLYPSEAVRVGGRLGNVAPDGADCQVSIDVVRGEEKLMTAVGVVRMDG